MKIKNKGNTYLRQYDISVKPYLEYAEIQNIANQVVKLSTWAERREIVDYMVLFYATDIGKEKIDETDLSDFIDSGLIDAVEQSIENYWQIDEAVKYEESLAKQLSELIDKLPQIAKTAVENAKRSDS